MLVMFVYSYMNKIALSFNSFSQTKHNDAICHIWKLRSRTGHVYAENIAYWRPWQILLLVLNVNLH